MAIIYKNNVPPSRVTSALLREISPIRGVVRDRDSGSLQSVGEHHRVQG